MAVDKRFNREVQEAVENHLKVIITTSQREVTNEEGQQVIQTLGKVTLMWDNNPFVSSEAVILETPVQTGTSGFGA